MNTAKAKMSSSLKYSKLLLLGLLASLIAIHLTLSLRTESLHSWSPDASFRLCSNAVMFWAATGFLLWSKRHTLNLGSSSSSKACGSLLITGVLIASVWLSGAESFLRGFPLLSLLGVALLACDFTKLAQFWRELLVLSFLVPPQATIEALAVMGNVPTLTAYFATALLWCLGFVVRYQDAQVLLPHGGVYVSPECAGVGSMVHLLGLSVLYLALFPTRYVDRYLLPLAALVIAFINNGARVAMLAVLSAFTNPQTFEYWHTGSGSHVNSVLSVLLLGLICLYLQRQLEHHDPDSVKQHDL